jgi:hypothetical protein
MTYRRLRFLIALIAALTLPLQAMAGLAMPLGGQSADLVDAAVAAMPEDCPMHQQQAPVPSQRGDCGHCGVCHLAATGFIVTAEAGAAIVPAVETYVAAIEAAPSSHIPKPPQQPPKRFA